MAYNTRLSNSEKEELAGIIRALEKIKEGPKTEGIKAREMWKLLLSVQLADLSRFLMTQIMRDIP